MLSKYLPYHGFNVPISAVAKCQARNKAVPAGKTLCCLCSSSEHRGAKSGCETQKNPPFPKVAFDRALWPVGDVLKSLDSQCWVCWCMQSAPLPPLQLLVLTPLCSLGFAAKFPSGDRGFPSGGAAGSPARVTFAVTQRSLTGRKQKQRQPRSCPAEGRAQAGH